MYVQFWTSILNIEVSFLIRTSTPTSICYHYYILFLIINRKRWKTGVGVDLAYDAKYDSSLSSSLCSVQEELHQYQLPNLRPHLESSTAGVGAQPTQQRVLAPFHSCPWMTSTCSSRWKGYCADPSLPPKQVAAIMPSPRGWMTKFIHSLIAL